MGPTLFDPVSQQLQHRENPILYYEILAAVVAAAVGAACQPLRGELVQAVFLGVQS